MDERLRALERAARSNPGDREATWSLVRRQAHHVGRSIRRRLIRVAGRF